MWLAGWDVAAFLGKEGDSDVMNLAEQHLPVVTALARSYTRGNGFDPDNGDPYEDVSAVIICATARLMSNPSGVQLQVAGPFTTRPGVFTGWSLAETFVLNRYRKRAA